VLALWASWLAWRALSALALTVLPSCSIDAAVSCKALACRSVRWLRWALPLAICALAVATPSLLWRIDCTISRGRRGRLGPPPPPRAGFP
jgi:hypothetical protein